MSTARRQNKITTWQTCQSSLLCRDTRHSTVLYITVMSCLSNVIISTATVHNMLGTSTLSCLRYSNDVLQGVEMIANLKL